MRFVMRTLNTDIARLLLFAVVAASAGGTVGAQALSESVLGNGTRVVVVAQPLADVTSCAWRDPVPEGGVRSTVSGQLTLAADLRAAFDADRGDDDDAPRPEAPAVIIALGPTPTSELAAILGPVLSERVPRAPDARRLQSVREGGLERRLGPLGAEAELRLELPLPSPDDPARTSIEVLWELVPGVLGDVGSGLAGRVDEHGAVLRAMVDPDLAELALRQVRLGLARLGTDPRIDPDSVEEARRRVVVRRAARLENHPDGALAVLDRYETAGMDGVRELLFGPSGVTLEAVRAAATDWLPRHPGAAMLVLPPRVFNPRFAKPPVEVRLDSDLAATVLERSATPLASLALRPVMSPDVDGELAAVVLTRLAGELRGGFGAPGWSRVTTRPATLEVAALQDAFPELVEALQRALLAVSGDDTPVAGEPTDARRRALQLTSTWLGLGGSDHVVPSQLLRPANLAVGAVVPDAEAGVEALRKLLVIEPRAADVDSLPASPRTREAVAGTRSSLVVLLDLPPVVDASAQVVLENLLVARATSLFAPAECEVLRPLVPGRRTLLLVVTAEGSVDAVERILTDRWERLMAATSEAELSTVRRAAAARELADASGATGAARRCASVAAGDGWWRPASEVEMAILGVEAASVEAALDAIRSYADLETLGAGVLPIPGAPPRR